MITVEMTGKARLGNQLFMYALARSVAEKRGFNFYINHKTWLGGNLIKCDLGKIDGAIRHVYQDPDIEQAYNPAVFNVEDFTEFKGYFQTDKYFSREKVKEWFTVMYPHSVMDFHREFPAEEYCYINVRGTDQAQFGHLVLPQSFYDNARNIILQYNPNLKFVVLTDDVPLAKKYFPNYPVFSNDRDTDFCLFNSASFVIGAISTFVWWACYLNDNNVVIMPKNFFGHNFNDEISRPTDIMTDKFIWIR